MRKWIFAVAMFSLFTMACNDSHLAGGSSDSKRTFAREYRFSTDCDTGAQEVTATDEAEALRKLCTRLQDEDANRGCAQASRRTAFNDWCPGQAWAPFHTPKPQPSPTSKPGQPPQPQPQPTNAWGHQSEILDGLRDLVAEETVAIGTLDQATQKYMNDIANCGFQAQGPQCLDDRDAFAEESGLIEEALKPVVFTYQIKPIELGGTSLLLKFTVEKIAPKVQTSFVEVYKVIKSRGQRSVSEFINDATSLTPLFSVKIAQDSTAAAWTAVKNASTARVLYHSAALLEKLAMTGSIPPVYPQLAREIENHKSVLVVNKDVVYQAAVMDWLDHVPGLNKSVLMEVAEAYVNSPYRTVAETASTIVLNEHPDRRYLKPTVVAALDNSSWKVRLRAIDALSKQKLSLDEQNKILSLINDGDVDVRARAVKYSATLSVNSDNLPVVEKLASSSDWKTRVQGVKLLGRIGTPVAIDDLIGHIDDGDADVQKTVGDQLNAMPLGDAQVGSLGKKLKSSDWKVRTAVVKQLTRINGDASTFMLISDLGDGDKDVQAAIVATLNSRSLNENHVDALSSHLKDSDWKIRQSTAKLIAKIDGDRATNALIANMGDGDKDVRGTIQGALMTRNLGGDNMATNIGAFFANSDWEIRSNVAKLLGRIKTYSSRRILTKQLTVEQDNDVKNQIIQSMKQIGV